MSRYSVTAFDDEVDLVARAVRGDGDAFGELYERHVARIYRYIYYMARSAVEAEDLTAQAFLNAWQAMPSYEVRGPAFIYWLLRIAHNVTINHTRQQSNHKSISEAADFEDTAPTPERALETQADGDRVRRALLRLDPVQRHVLVLRLIEDLPYSEIAEIMGKSGGAVRVIHHRALNKLRVFLQEDNEQPARSSTTSNPGVSGVQHCLEMPG